MSDDEIVIEAKDRFRTCEEWEAPTRRLFDYDYKFANGDSHNMYQWDNRISSDRFANNRPVLTVNKVNQHNLMVINDAKQNKPGVNIRPVGDDASFEAAQVFQGIVRHIEYISNAESVYDHATTFQVEAGIGYWRIQTDYMSPKSFDQEIYIRSIKDPRSVYLDPDITEDDGSDARFGFIFEDMPKDLYDDKYPEFKDLGWSTTFNQKPDMWVTRDLVRVAEYYRKTQKKDKFVYFINHQTGEAVQKFLSELEPDEKAIYTEIKKSESQIPEAQRSYKERKILTDNIEWFKIAGNTIIDRGPWMGKYIPIVRLVGTETIIDGVMDRKGHTRALIDPQKIYNWNTSANQEYGALQTKSPYVAATKAIEGYEEIYKTANTVNHSYLPYNSLDEDGNVIPPPTRNPPPTGSPAYMDQLKISENEMMAASGQYQAQMGENENAKSGVAINARQRQGDRATYHFIDNNAKAIRYTGKILIDLIPKVYDTKRVMQISATDGSIMSVTVDPEAQAPFQKQQPGPEGPVMDKGQEIAQIIFNPNIGTYDIQSEVGPSYATKRQEAFNALTQIAAQNKEFMGVAGDILWKVADFPEAQVLAERWRKIIPPNLTGDTPNPQIEQAMHAASDKIEQQLALIAQQQKELADRETEFRIKAQEAETKYKTAVADASRLDYEAETRRLVALGNSGPAVTVEQISPIVRQLITGMLNAQEPGSAAQHGLEGHLEGGTPIPTGEAPVEGQESAPEAQEVALAPPVPGARKAPDGQHYLPDPNRPGKFLRVEANG